MHALRRAWIAAALAAAVAGCANLRGYEIAGEATPPPPTATPTGPTPSPNGSASPTPSPAPVCTIAPTQSTNEVLIAMALSILPASVPTYGSVFGYGDATSGTVPSQSAVIAATTADVVQFLNYEGTPVTNAIYHSAYGFPGATTFPATPYTFVTTSPVGTAIGNAAWSTGRIQPVDASGNPCYSTPLSLPNPGTYLFGDIDFFNSTNFRGVLVVSTPGPSGSAHRRVTAVRPLK